jgi:hypothetical protein
VTTIRGGASFCLRGGKKYEGSGSRQRNGASRSLAPITVSKMTTRARG